MLRAHCESCKADSPVFVHHYLDEGDQEQRTDIQCEVCDHIVASFVGKVQLEDLGAKTEMD